MAPKKDKDMEETPKAPKAVEVVKETHEEAFMRINEEVQPLVGKTVFVNGSELEVRKAVAKDVTGVTHVELFDNSRSTIISVEEAQKQL